MAVLGGGAFPYGRGTPVALPCSLGGGGLLLRKVPLHPQPEEPSAGSAAILCTGGPDVIRKEAWPFYRTISGVRLCWELEEPEGSKGPVAQPPAQPPKIRYLTVLPCL